MRGQILYIPIWFYSNNESRYLSSFLTLLYIPIWFYSNSNPVEYAPYVEFGHRTRGGGFKDPQFMLTISEEKLRAIIPKLLERKVKKMLQEVLDA